MQFIKQATILALISSGALAVFSCTGGVCLTLEVDDIRDQVSYAGDFINIFAPSSTYTFDSGGCQLAITPSAPDQDTSVSQRDIQAVIDRVEADCRAAGTPVGFIPGGQELNAPGTPSGVEFAIRLYQAPVSETSRQGGTRRARSM